MKINQTLNYRSQRLCELCYQLEEELRIKSHVLDNGAMVYDFGVHAVGGQRAGIHLAEICLAGLADVKLVSGPGGPELLVATDHPVTACMGAQYAGWQINAEGYFAMGSGPMRAAAGKESLLIELQLLETHPECAVGVLEATDLPSAEQCEELAKDCGIDVRKLSLCVAPTTSYAGNLQVVARSVETALHKLHELGYPIACVESAVGQAPIPPVAADAIGGIGRTNDAILYGGQVTLCVRDDDDTRLASVVPQVPSSASRDFGKPFAEIFRQYDGDFYQIDPHLFSPAVVRVANRTSGKVYEAGVVRPDLLAQSFAGEA